MEQAESSKIDLYVEDMKKDMELTEVNIHDKSLTVPAVKIKWIAILHREQAYLKRLENADRELIDRSFAQNPNRPRFQHERDLIDSGKLVAVRKAIEEQKEVVSTLTDLVKMVVAGYGMEVGNVVKLLALEQ